MTAPWLTVGTERAVEIPWLLPQLGQPARLLDVGSVGADYVPWLYATGAQVTLLDPRATGDAAQGWVRGSLGATPADWAARFDCVTCISTLDHIGLDAYGQVAEAGLLERACADLARITAPRGRLLLTVPCGQDQWTTHPEGGQRVFSLESLVCLFPGAPWAWLSVNYWQLVGDAYEPAAWPQVQHATYAGHRAGAVFAGLLERRNG